MRGVSPEEEEKGYGEKDLQKWEVKPRMKECRGNG